MFTVFEGHYYSNCIFPLCLHKKKSQEKSPKPFIEAIQMELEAYQDMLEFHSEVPLTSEPLRIDCIIIKKTKDMIIKKNIAAIFRQWNLLEYKSPDDYVSVDDFYKVYAYACLYVSFEKIPITDLTVTFIESRYPEKLIEHLEQVRGYAVAETAPGIYTVTGNQVTAPTGR